MKERPILFSAPMVRAILAGTKTQTRRSVRFRGAEVIEDRGKGPQEVPWPWSPQHDGWVSCPFGAPGDRLWVRETWRVGAWRDDGRVALDFAASPELVSTPWLRPPAESFKGLAAQGLDDCRRAVARGALSIEEHADGRFTWPHGASPCRWRPSIHMPRWASRLTLEVTDVRVERLQAISREDCIAKGCTGFDPEPVSEGGTYYVRPGFSSAPDPRAHFQILWESIDGVGSWEANPWVWVVGFKKAVQP